MSKKSKLEKFSTLAAKLSVIIKKRDEYSSIQETKFHQQINDSISDFEENSAGSIYSMKHIPIMETISYSINTLTPEIHKGQIEEIDQKMMESSFTKLSKNSSAASSLVLEKKDEKINEEHLSRFNYLHRLCHNGSTKI